jgi:uncharacterized protein YoxC
MVGANQILLTVLLTLCSVLVVFLIVICVKLINTTEKLNVILDDAYRKLKSVDGVFNALDTVSDAVTTVSETVVGKILLVVEKLFKKEK